MDYHQTKKLRNRLIKRKESHIQNLHSETERLTEEAIKLGAKKVILFGSAAGGNPTSSSDLDLIIILDSKVDFLNRIVSAHHKLKPRVGVDLLIYTPEEIKKMGKSAFVQHAIKEGRVLYET